MRSRGVFYYYTGFFMNEIFADTINNETKYQIHVENFDGPLDLLWELIKKAKIDISEVSISKITEQYIGYLKLMENLNVKLAIEFIWMASELLYYKSKALLPSGKIEDEYFVPPLPPELIQKLLEYKKYQKASSELLFLFDSVSDSYQRVNHNDNVDHDEHYGEASLFDLLKAFSRVLESSHEIEHEEIIFDEILVSDRMEHIIHLLKENEAILFIDVFSPHPSRHDIVATFLAILEMAKTKMIRIVQHRVFGDIRILRNFTLQDIS